MISCENPPKGLTPFKRLLRKHCNTSVVPNHMTVSRSHILVDFYKNFFKQSLSLTMSLQII